jgi:hypothetical protein
MLTMYVLVRKDLNEVYRMVQGTHAVAAYSFEGDRKLWDAWNNGKLIIMSVDGEGQLELAAEKLSDKEVRWVGFTEPDMNYETTSLACITDDDKLFNRYQLVKQQ